MSGEARHFRARVPRTLAEQPRPVDVIITSTFGALSARPATERGRAFLSAFYITPRLYTEQDISIQPGRFWQTFRQSLREQGLRAKHDGTGNGREVE